MGRGAIVRKDRSSYSAEREELPTDAMSHVLADRGHPTSPDTPAPTNAGSFVPPRRNLKGGLEASEAISSTAGRGHSQSL